MAVDPTALSLGAWLLLALAAFGIGITKSGFSGVSLVHVLIFAYVFGAKASTGIVLPMLIAGDTIAMLMFGQHADWSYVRRMLPPAILGVLGAWLLMDGMSEVYYRPTIGCIILGLAVLQILRMFREQWFIHVPHSRWFAWTNFSVAPQFFQTVVGPNSGLHDVHHHVAQINQYPFTGVLAFDTDDLATRRLHLVAH